MSIAILNQVYAESRRLAIAGSNLAVGDFRLKKLVEPLEKSAAKAPVFGAVAKAIDKLVAGPEKDSAQSLLDLCSLVMAILYTQGQTGAEGEPKPIQTKELSLSPAQAPARTLKPIIEALTSVGGGRMEVIKEGFEGGVFDDIRLVNPAITALDDNYGEIADFVVENILPKFGKAILPEIRDKIDISGRAGNVRRLRLLHQLDPAGARPIVLEAFEKGSKEMKIAAIGCLGDSAEDLPHLLEQAEAKSKEVRKVALSRLGKFDESECITVLTKALAGADRPLVVESIRNSQSPALWKTVIETTRKELDALFKEKDKEKLSKALERFDELLGCYHARSDKLTIEALSAIHDTRSELRKLKGSPVSGEDVFATLSETMLCSNHPDLMKRLIDDRDAMIENRFVCSIAAGLLSLSAKAFYDTYSPYFLQKPAKSRSKGEAPREVIAGLIQNTGTGSSWYGWAYLHRHSLMPAELMEKLRSKDWDARWLDATISVNELQAAIRLADPKHAGLKKYLLERFESGIKSKSLDYELYACMKAIADLNYPEATDCWIQLLQRQVKIQSRYYSAYFLAPLVSKLPKSSASKIEESLQGLPDPVVDEIMPHLQTLKAKVE